MTIEVDSGKGKYGNRGSLLVQVVDHERLTKIVRRDLVLEHEWLEDDAKLVNPMPVVIVRNRKRCGDSSREVCVVTHEGVGYETNGMGRINIPFRVGRGMYTNCTPVSALSVSNLGSGEMVDLAEWVRVFGDRLENNFSLWYSIGTQGSARDKWDKA